MNRKLFSLLGFLLFFTFSLSFVHADVEVFSQYNTYININSDYTFDVHKEVYIRNVHDVGIVPGQVEFKIMNSDGNGGEILSYSAKDRYGNDIRGDIMKTADATYIIFDIFTPVLPGFEYKIDLNYKISYDSSGFLFKNVELPLKEGTKIPIKEGIVEITLPENYHLTYLSYEDNSTVIDNNKVSWEISQKSPESVNLEYSYIPIRFGDVRGSVVFWLLVNVVLICVLFIQIIREVRRLKKGK